MRGEKLLIAKAYFDKGLSHTNYIKYLIAFFGFSSQDVKLTMIIGIIYAISCYIYGRLFYYFKFIETENEINNRFNPFVNDVRKNLKSKRFSVKRKVFK